jgi:hypothetical protein
MSAIDKLACSLGRRDEIPNQELARALVKANDTASIREIAANLWNKDPNTPADCIKVLYEIGYLKPKLISAYAGDFLKLLKIRNNRLIWGGMIALSTVGALAADELYPHTAEIQEAMGSGSVITRDAGVLALAGIASTSDERRKTIFPYLLEHLRTCRPKDVPQHSEKMLGAVSAANKAEFITVLEKRMEDLQGMQVTRVKKVIKQAENH